MRKPKKPIRVQPFIGLLLDSHEKLKERLIMLEESFRERLILWEIPVEKTNGKANLSLGHLLHRHDRELE